MKLIFGVIINCIIALTSQVKATCSSAPSAADWMSCIEGNLKLNQINIPGTHDSGTYDIGKTTNHKALEFYLSPLFWGINKIQSIFAQTQNLNIEDQLLNGIRYLDVRLGLDEKNNLTKELYLIHEIIPYDCIKFLNEHKEECIIIHLNQENIAKGSNPFQQLIDITVNNTNKISNPTNEEKTLVRDFIQLFNNNEENYLNKEEMPTLDEVRGKIVLFSRDKYHYGQTEEDKKGKTLAIYRDPPDTGECLKFRYKEWECYPRIIGNTRFQDDYNLKKEEKWAIVYEMFKGDIAKNATHLYFNDVNNSTVHTFNFMNVARVSPPKSSYIGDTFFDSNIEASANYVNNELTLLIPDLSTSFHNEWIIMDYPSADSIRSVYESNFSKDLKLLNYKLNLNNGDTSFGEGIKYLFSRLVTLLDKRNMNTDEPQACLQRIIDKQGNDLIKNGLPMISGKGKFYSLISVYDEKCLNYSNNSWYMQECMSNNKGEDFTIRNGKICSRLDESQCLEGQFNLEPTILQPSEYENLTCSTKFVKRGYKCCSNPNRCLSGKTMSFGTDKDEWSEWYIESWDGKIVNSIDEIVRNNTNLDLGVLKPDSSISTLTTTKTSSTSKKTPTPTTRNCPFQDYPCCSPENKSIEFIDADGFWECLSSQKNFGKKPLIRNCLDDDNFQWIVYPSPKGYFHPKMNPTWCMVLQDVENGKIKVGNCTDNSIFQYTSDGLIKSPLSPDECLGKGDRKNDPTNANGGYLKPCEKNADQIWSAWDRNPASLFNAEIQNVWIYSPELKKCLLSGSALTYRPVIGNCVNSNAAKWEIPKSQDGFFKSLKSCWYLRVSNIDQGTIIMSDTLDQSSIINKCLGRMNSNTNESRLTLNVCNNAQNDQKWEIRTVFPSSQ
ncbi:PLC-like phosphodiesterase [Neocallimastix lanati (nom. inval.)]|nr:PLC-like phosphodiesterase [Neocallimastix sp. JGI-2020a]